MSAGAARALPAPGGFGAWLAAARPQTLTAAVAPVLAGTGAAIGDGAFAAGPFVAALFGALCLQVGANFANDVFDFERGADAGDRLGPPRATQSGLLTPAAMKLGMWLAFLLALLAGVYLVVMAGWIVVVIGLASIAAGLIYTGGPWPIGYHALGDAFTFTFFGMVAVVGTYFVQAEAAPGAVWLAAVPLGCTVTAILVANNLRDLATDRAAGKTTLAVVLGDRGTRAWYALLLAAAYGVAITLWPATGAGAWALLPLASLPLAVAPLRAVAGGTAGRALNATLVQTARLHLVFGALLALALTDWLPA